jgi:hypothetical protein
LDQRFAGSILAKAIDFKGDKIRSTPSLGGEVNPEVTRRKILRQAEIHLGYKYEQRYFEGKIYHFFRQVPPDLVPDDC